MPGRPRATYRERMTSVRQITVPACLCAGAYGLLIRPRLRRWGATAAEVHQPYPGAELIPGGRRTATMRHDRRASIARVAMAGADGLQPRGLVQLGPPRQP